MQVFRCRAGGASLTLGFDVVGLDGVALADLVVLVPVRGRPDQGQQDEQNTCYAEIHLVKPNLGKAQVAYEEHFNVNI